MFSLQQLAHRMGSGDAQVARHRGSAPVTLCDSSLHLRESLPAGNTNGVLHL